MGYQGLLWLCGVERRPDLALQIIYAMGKEGLLEGGEAGSLKCYERGKEVGGAEGSNWRIDLRAYEDIMEVECSQFNEGDKKIRILL